MNLFDGIPEPGEEETVEILYQESHCRVERIISHGQVTAPDTWYDQTEDEWVSLLQGEATLLVEKEKNDLPCVPDTVSGGAAAKEEWEILSLHRGDTVLIKAGKRHRVTFTSKDPPAVWLCIFVKAGF